jgi:PPOX class probable F420-dependent enzyme
VEAARVAPRALPASHRDLVDGPYPAVLSTVMPDGSPQTTPVWCNAENGYVLVNTMKGFRKERNMRRTPRVALLVYDPSNPLRHMEIRGVVAEMTEHGAGEHLDQLTRLYMGKPDASFFGDCIPRELASTYVPVRVTIAPTHVRTEG